VLETAVEQEERERERERGLKKRGKSERCIHVAVVQNILPRLSSSSSQPSFDGRSVDVRAGALLSTNKSEAASVIDSKPQWVY